MIIRGKIGMSEAEFQQVVDMAKRYGVAPQILRTPNHEHQAFIGLHGDTSQIPEDAFRGLPGVDDAIRVMEKHKYASRTYKPDDTIVEVGDVQIGYGRPLVIMAGPCAVESLEQIKTIARAVKRAGAKMLRGGAYKPRTNARSFEGLGETGLKFLAEAREETGLLIVTEVMTPAKVEEVAKYADMLQIGARNGQNYDLLKEVGRQQKPVLLKNAIAATIEEFLGAADYILTEGNNGVVLCLRGERTGDASTRYAPNAHWTQILRQKTHLPIVYDPSHPAGKRDLVESFARAGIAYGVDGLLIEVHTDPTKAKTDEAQQITPPVLERIVVYARQHEMLTNALES